MVFPDFSIPIFFKLLFTLEKGGGQENEGRAERAGEDTQTDSMLSAGPNAGLHFGTLRSGRAEIKSWLLNQLDHAGVSPHFSYMYFFFNPR